jgi:hypothetical protein
MNPIYRAVLLIYFITHIPITILIDLQAILAQHYPEALKTFMKTEYAIKYGDFLMLSPPVWMKSLIVFELFQLPFFFFAAYALIYKKNVLRIPSIIYGSHVTTAVSVILSEFYFSDKITTSQKVVLFSFYLPYLIIPFTITVYMAFTEKPFEDKKKTK